MPIAIRFFVLVRPRFAVLLRVRIAPPTTDAKASVADVRGALAKRLPPRLVRDVLPD